MKTTKPLIVIATMICMSFMNAAMAAPWTPPWKPKPIHHLGARVAELETLVAELQAELERVSPDADLTGTTYCIIGQGTWLSAGNGGAEVVTNPFSARVDFTSATEVTVVPIYDPYSSILLPSFTMSDDGDSLATEFGTYTLVGNLLTVTVPEETTSFYITPDAQVVVGGFFERSVDGSDDIWETGMIVGTRAASCD